MQAIYQNPFVKFGIKAFYLQSYLYFGIKHAMIQHQSHHQCQFLSTKVPSFPPTRQHAFLTGTLSILGTVIFSY